MGVEHDISLRGVRDINRQSARYAIVKLQHLAIVRRKDWCSSRRHDVERFMMTGAAAQIVEAVDEFVGRDALHRDHEVV